VRCWWLCFQINTVVVRKAPAFEVRCQGLSLLYSEKEWKVAQNGLVFYSWKNTFLQSRQIHMISILQVTIQVITHQYGQRINQWFRQKPALFCSLSTKEQIDLDLKYIPMNRSVYLLNNKWPSIIKVYSVVCFVLN